MTDDPIDILTKEIAEHPTPGPPGFQVTRAEDETEPFPIYEQITPDGCGVDVGMKAIREAVAMAVSELNRHGFEIVKK